MCAANFVVACSRTVANDMSWVRETLYDVLRWASCMPLRSVLSCLQFLWQVQDPSLCVTQAFIVGILHLRSRHGAKIIYDTDDDNRLKDERLVLLSKKISSGSAGTHFLKRDAGGKDTYPWP